MSTSNLIEETAMATSARPLAVTAALIVRIGIGLLITFAAAVVLIHAEIYFSDPSILPDRISSLF
jgi:hypothetical protein